MDCQKLTVEELALWKDMDEVEYRDSPLHNQLSEEEYAFVAEFCSAAAYDSFKWMHNCIHQDPALYARCEKNPMVHDMLKRAYEHGVACGDAACCCNLANMYHNTRNEGTEEEYATAVELYELGASRGDGQCAVNLGYIYYYGRGTEVDYSRAYECFAHGALVCDNPEGYWKLGDLYAGGKGVQKSAYSAWKLYCRAYEAAGDSPLAARAAHHMADYLLTGIEGHLEADSEQALALYNQAERGYYALITGGLSYYSGQLEQAIAGQDAARAALQEEHRRLRSPNMA